jgi:phospholipase C
LEEGVGWKEESMQPHNPIEHVVIIVKENHAFDNYFGTFPGANGMTMPRSPNPPPQDPNHTHEAWLKRETNAVRAQFVEQDLPAYFAFARQFTLCDNYFTDVAGPSTPNHLMLVTADSPLIDNHASDYRGGGSQPLFDLPSLPALLDQAKWSWTNYGGYVFSLIKALRDHPSNLFQHDPKNASARFAIDAQAGKLPAVAWVYAPHEFSEHAPDPQDKGKNVGNVTLGAQWTADQIDAVVQGGLWHNTAIFVTWDDWGGWYDHVNPPEVEKWKNDGTPNAGTQFRYGTRVGCLVLSPYARRGYISQMLHSHVSLIKFVEDTFGLGSLTARDAATNGMVDCFDFTQTPLAPPASAAPGSTPAPAPKSRTTRKSKPKRKTAPRRKPIKRARRTTKRKTPKR